MRTPPRSDHDLIRNCIAYAQNVAAYSAGFDADPDGNSQNIQDKASTKQFGAAAERALKNCCGRANTVDGIEAKARIAPKLIEIDSAHTQSVGELFLCVFADDVRRYMSKIDPGEGRMMDFDEPTVGVAP